MKRPALVLAFVVIVAIGALFIFTKKASTPSSQVGITSDESSKNTPSSEPTTNPPVASITYADDGFSPETITVKVGDKIAVNNHSSRILQFSSNPHPIHTQNKELNQDSIPAGGSLTFTVKERGTFGYHDHFNSNRIGTIVVE